MEDFIPLIHPATHIDVKGNNEYIILSLSRNVNLPPFPTMLIGFSTCFHSIDQINSLHEILLDCWEKKSSPPPDRPLNGDGSQEETAPSNTES